MLQYCRNSFSLCHNLHLLYNYHGIKENGKSGKIHGFFQPAIHKLAINHLSNYTSQVISDYLNKNKSRITAYLDLFFSAKKQELSFLGEEGQEVLQRLFDFTVRGKMVRGGCTILGYNLFSDKQSDIVLPAAAAAELFQSALLIHDDIMDRDESRRGFPSLYFQYHQVLKEKSLPDALHSGESLAICGGDIAFFLGYELLSRLRPSETGMKIIEYVSKELTGVAVAQMIDVKRGIDPVFPDEEAIIELYRYKTGRYTFSLPLWMGARLAGTEERNFTILEKMGELMGILFQLKDDELGLFGDDTVMGKPVGSDLREGKKTLHIALLHRMASEADRRVINAVMTEGEITGNGIKEIRECAERLKLKQYIESRYLRPLTAELQRLLNDLSDAFPQAIKIVDRLIIYITDRIK